MYCNLILKAPCLQSSNSSLVAWVTVDSVTNSGLWRQELLSVVAVVKWTFDSSCLGSLTNLSNPYIHAHVQLPHLLAEYQQMLDVLCYLTSDLKGDCSVMVVGCWAVPDFHAFEAPRMTYCYFIEVAMHTLDCFMLRIFRLPLVTVNHQYFLKRPDCRLWLIAATMGWK